MNRWTKRLPLWLVIPGAFVALRLIKFGFGRLFESLLGMDGLAPNLTPVAFAADLALGLALALVVAGMRRIVRRGDEWPDDPGSGVAVVRLLGAAGVGLGRPGHRWSRRTSPGLI